MEKIEMMYSPRVYKYSKEVYLNAKQSIKDLSAEQVKLKDLRKTKHRKEVSDITPEYATSKHMSNRYKLRVLHIVYAMIREKQFDTEFADNNKYSIEVTLNKLKI